MEVGYAACHPNSQGRDGGGEMKTESETDRLNRIGAEIMGWKRIERDKYYPDDDLDYWGSEKEYYYSIKDWSPATDLNHTDMVKKELIKRGWEWQESLAIMRAVEKAWEVGKKEK